MRKKVWGEYELAVLELRQALIDENNASSLLVSARNRVKTARAKVSNLYEEHPELELANQK